MYLNYSPQIFQVPMCVPTNGLCSDVGTMDPGIQGTPKDSALVITAERSARFLWSLRQYLHSGIKSVKGI